MIAHVDLVGLLLAAVGGASITAAVMLERETRRRRAEPEHADQAP